MAALLSERPEGQAVKVVHLGRDQFGDVFRVWLPTEAPPEQSKADMRCLLEVHRSDRRLCKPPRDVLREMAWSEVVKAAEDRARRGIGHPLIPSRFPIAPAPRPQRRKTVGGVVSWPDAVDGR